MRVAEYCALSELRATAGLRCFQGSEVRNDSESCEESQPLFSGSPFVPDSS
jgi:hypothetical protein